MFLSAKQLFSQIALMAWSPQIISDCRKRSCPCRFVRMRSILNHHNWIPPSTGMKTNLSPHFAVWLFSMAGCSVNYIPDREASLIKKEYCRCGPHPLQVTSPRARPPLVKGAGCICIGPLFPDFRGWPLWFMASIALQGLHKPCTGGCSWRLIAL